VSVGTQCLVRHEDHIKSLMIMMMMMMMMSFICCYRNKIGAELHLNLEEGTYYKRLFRGTRGTSTNHVKK
jgi:hypothetical protein